MPTTVQSSWLGRKSAVNDGSYWRARATFSPSTATVSGATRLPQPADDSVDDGDRRRGIAVPQIPARTLGDQQLYPNAQTRHRGSPTNDWGDPRDRLFIQINPRILLLRRVQRDARPQID